MTLKELQGIIKNHEDLLNMTVTDAMNIIKERTNKNITFINITNHELTEEQIHDLRYTNIVELPKDIKEKWKNVTPENMCDILEDVLNFIYNLKRSKKMVALVQGHMGATYSLIGLLEELEVEAVYSHTKRGAFKHDGFYRY